jgi:starch-binding outer membrane protein, SusD/RagB family
MRYLNFVARVGCVAAVTLSITAIACSGDPLAVDLDVITPASAASSSGAQAMRNTALYDMWYSTGYNVFLWANAGLLSDELINARPGYEEVDRRSVNNNASPVSNGWSGFARPLYSGPRAIRALRAYVQDSPTRQTQIGEIQALRGLILTIGGEIYCNGIPMSYLNDDGTTTYDPKSYTNTDLFNLAVVHFDSALASLPANSTLRSLARIGKARALVNLGQQAQAAVVVRAGGDGAGSAAVPSTYSYNAEYSSATLTNGPYDWMNSTSNFATPYPSEAPNTMSWDDPRIKPVFLRMGQDGTTRAYWPSAVALLQTVNSPYPLATGTEARLIEAEADLKAGQATWLTTLNALRSASPLSAQLPALVDPGTDATRVDMVFKERAMWMYLTIHRLGDMRRLIRQYARAREAVFPTGAYFKGGVYGTDVALQPSLTEVSTNPNWKACTNLDP